MKIREYRKQIIKILVILAWMIAFVVIYMSYILNGLGNQTSNVMGMLLTTFFLSVGVILFILGVFIYIAISDIRRQRKLYEYAYIDPVTQKGNIYYFRKNGQERLNKEPKKYKYMIILDINKFKMINKAYGYAMGDKILINIGNKLEEIFGKTSLIARYSNDYFAILFDYEDNIYTIISKIINKIENLKINNVTYNLTVNMGIYKIKDSDSNISEVIDKAIIAHSASKGNVYERYYIYDEELEKVVEEEERIEAKMYNALMAKEFKVYFQPKIFTDNEKMYGAEALARWEHKGKIISPEKFIPLFEKNKFILKLDTYIFEEVCKNMRLWKEELGLEPIISINVSRDHFMDEHFLEKYYMIVAKYGINPNKIDLEITESAAFEEGIDIIEIMNRIKKLGFLVSIDDFGTGYSSLSMIQDMPIDIIKIDKSFVDRIGQKKKNMIDYIIKIAKELGLMTIAEGVETKEQRDYLLKKDCDVIQGYYYSKPLPLHEFEEYLKTRSKE